MNGGDVATIVIGQYQWQVRLAIMVCATSVAKMGEQPHGRITFVLS